MGRTEARVKPTSPALFRLHNHLHKLAQPPSPAPAPSRRQRSLAWARCCSRWAKTSGAAGALHGVAERGLTWMRPSSRLPGTSWRRPVPYQLPRSMWSAGEARRPGCPRGLQQSPGARPKAGRRQPGCAGRAAWAWLLDVLAVLPLPPTLHHGGDPVGEPRCLPPPARNLCGFDPSRAAHPAGLGGASKLAARRSPGWPEHRSSCTACQPSKLTFTLPSGRAATGRRSGGVARRPRRCGSWAWSFGVGSRQTLSPA